MLKYNLNLRNGSAKSRMCMISLVLSLTLSLGFTSRAAVVQEDGVPVTTALHAETVLAGYSAAEVSRKFANMNRKLSAQAEEALYRAEEEAKALEDQRAAEAQQAEEEEAFVQESSQPLTSYTGSDYEKELLASIIFCEAGNQSFTGQVAVGAVVMNRIASSAYPNTMEEVIYQSGQFGPAGSGWLDQVRSARGYTDSAMQAAEAALAGENPVGECLYFDQGGYGMQIGAHYFH